MSKQPKDIRGESILKPEHVVLIYPRVIFKKNVYVKLVFFLKVQKFPKMFVKSYAEKESFKVKYV